MIGNVNVPGALAADIANKVDKIAGKGLSTEDYTTAEKNKLAGLSNPSDATASSKGIVQIGSNISVSNGTISVPTASAQTAGVVKIGSGLSISNGVVSVDSSASGPTITYGTADLTDGVSSLATGIIYFVYE